MKLSLHISNSLIGGVALCVLLASCGGAKQSAAEKLIADANVLYSSGSYAEAVAKYRLSNKDLWTESTARLATIAASKANQDSLAIVFASSKNLNPTGDTLLVESLLKSHSSLGNSQDVVGLMLENQNLCEAICGKANVVNTLAGYYTQNKDRRLVELFPLIDFNDLKEETFNAYFKMSRNDLDDKEKDGLCSKVIKKFPNNETALFHLAKSKYDRAEELYQKTMNEYNKNKTQAAYAYMTRDLKKVISPMFRDSRDLFEKLLKVDASNKTYVKYLINIYTRLDNKDKVKALEKRL